MADPHLITYNTSITPAELEEFQRKLKAVPQGSVIITKPKTKVDYDWRGQCEKLLRLLRDGGLVFKPPLMATKERERRDLIAETLAMLQEPT